MIEASLMSDLVTYTQMEDGYAIRLSFRFCR